jgi:methionyl-tRNA formyltransferase
MMKLRVLLIGEQSAGIQTLRMLANTAHTVVAVMTTEPSTDAHNGVSSLWRVAQAFGYTTWPAQLIKMPVFIRRIESDAIDLILNVHSLYLIPGEVLQAARIGAFNLHPGPLPRYAGLNSVSWAIYRGETVHGVTVHQMVPKIDAGPIAYQALFSIQPSESAFAVSARCIREGVILLGRLLEAASRSPDNIPLIDQDLLRREYFGKEVPTQGLLSWSASARQIVNFVRACDFYPFPSPWGNPRTKLAGSEIAITRVSLSGQGCDAQPGTVRCWEGTIQVASSDEWIIVERLIVDGRRLSPGDVLKPGDQFRIAGSRSDHAMQRSRQSAAIDSAAQVDEFAEYFRDERRTTKQNGINRSKN